MVEAFREATGNPVSPRHVDSTDAGDLTEHGRIAELALSAGQGDEAAFSELYRLRVQKVAAYVFSIIRRQSDLEDVVADVFVRAWKRLPTLKDTRKFDSWLFSIAHNQAIDSVRKRKDTNVPIEDVRESLPGSSEDLPELAAIKSAETEHLMSVLTRLPEEPRMVLVLRFLHGMSHDEVARQIGKSAEAVRAMQYRALGRLRSMLIEDERAASDDQAGG